jgi:anaerobic glycerol-3-phosphate dehydrogenase
MPNAGCDSGTQASRLDFLVKGAVVRIRDPIEYRGPDHEQAAGRARWVHNRFFLRRPLAAFGIMRLDQLVAPATIQVWRN